MPRILTLTAAARMLKAHPDTITDAIRTRGLPAAKVGRCWLFVDDDLIEWLRSQYGQHSQAAERASAAREPAPVPRRSPSRTLSPDLAAVLAPAARRKSA